MADWYIILGSIIAGLFAREGVTFIRLKVSRNNKNGSKKNGDSKTQPAPDLDAISLIVNQARERGVDEMSTSIREAFDALRHSLEKLDVTMAAVAMTSQQVATGISTLTGKFETFIQLSK